MMLSLRSNKVTDMLRLEEESAKHENQNDNLCPYILYTLNSEMLKNKNIILKSISDASNETKQDLTEKLKTIISMRELSASSTTVKYFHFKKISIFFILLTSHNFI